MHRRRRESAAAVAAVPLACLLLACAGAPAAAQPPGPPAGPPPSGAKRDTSWTDALVRHGWIEGGFGWIAAPAHMRRRFEPGQGFAGGLQARPFAPLLLRAGVDYQIVLANGDAIYEPVPGKGPLTSAPDTFEVQSRAWSLGFRAEAGLRAPGGVWLLAGGGRDYFDGGIDDFAALVDPDVVLRIPEVARDGWGWSFSLGAARSLQGIVPWPIGLDVRWRSLRRGDEDLRWWTIRLGSMAR